MQFIILIRKQTLKSITIKDPRVVGIYLTYILYLFYLIFTSMYIIIGINV